MVQINFKIDLMSDAEPNSGFGSATLQGYVARNHKGLPMLPASHIKGLIREELINLEKVLDQPDLTKLLCGKNGAKESDEGLFRISDCIAQINEEQLLDCIMTITRTKIDSDTGTASDTSLRSTEAIRKGVVLEKGMVTHSFPKDSWVDIALRLALMNIRNVGGNRNRGSGACKIIIENEKTKPGELLKKLAKENIEVSLLNNQQSLSLSGERLWCELIFKADQAVCCPLYPSKSNAIESSFEIPASAVIGALLTHIASTHAKVATEIVEKNLILAYPLLPVGDESDIPCRISLSHKIAKLITADNIKAERDFQDEAVQELNWSSQGANNPLKSTDGLLINCDNKIRLWRSGDIARQLLAHGSRHTTDDEGKNNERGLFQMESIAPTTWKGWVSVPKECLPLLENLISVSFGKHRTVLGGGQLNLKPIKQVNNLELFKVEQSKANVFILQSPVSVDQNNPEDSFKNTICKWVKDNHLSQNMQSDQIVVWANYGWRFGWNRHLKNGYSGADFVALPGSVFKVNCNIDTNQLAKAFENGIGSNSGFGFGAVACHPGVATDLYEGNAKLEMKRKASDASFLQLVKEISTNKSKVCHLSPSQWYGLADTFYSSADKAKEYLNIQLEKRDQNVVANWKANKGLIEKIINHKIKKEAMQILKFAADLSGIKRKEQE